jgi:hypothetical protein
LRGGCSGSLGGSAGPGGPGGPPEPPEPPASAAPPESPAPAGSAIVRLHISKKTVGNTYHSALLSPPHPQHQP